MFYNFKCRLLVQKPGTKAIYSIPVVSATTHMELPFFVPQMDIEVLSRYGATDYIAPIRFDDIVRLQVSIQFSDYEKVVWQDIFGGRIQTPTAQFQTGKNTAKFTCVGHSDEARTKLLETHNNQSPYPFATDNIIENIFTTIMQLYGDRLCYDPGLNQENLIPQNGDTTDYQIKANQKYMIDFFHDIEKVTAYQWFFKERPRYNPDYTLISPTIIDFLPVFVTPVIPASGVAYINNFGTSAKVNVDGGTVSAIDINGNSTGSTSGEFTLKANDTITLTYSVAPVWNWTPMNSPYKVIEGTPRFLGADFTAKGDTVYTRAVVQGGTLGGTQFSWYAQDVTAMALFGTRVFSETDNGFGSSNMAMLYAAGIVEKFGYPIPAGQVTLQLTPEMQVGDYIPCIIPSVTLNGASINSYFTVTKVQHDISAGRATTTGDVGFTLATPDTYLLRFVKLAHLAMKNFIS